VLWAVWCIIGISTVIDITFHDVGIGSIRCGLLMFVLSLRNQIVSVRNELWVIFEALSVQYGEVGIKPLATFCQVGLGSDHENVCFSLH